MVLFKSRERISNLQREMEAKKTAIIQALEDITNHNFKPKEKNDALTEDVNESIQYLVNDLNKLMLELSNDITKIMDYIISIDVTNNATIQGFDTALKDVRAFAEGNKEMATSINEVATSAEHIANVTETAIARADKSKEYIKNSMQSFEEMYNDFINVTNRIQTLDNDMNEITDVINVIKGIAEQTNLLALNASIEAARAGEHGKGFAVVAQEIHKLAQGTKESIEHITDRISNVKNESKNTVTIVNQSSEKAKEVLGQITTVSESFDELMEAFNQSSTGIINIVPITNQQNAAVNESNEKIKTIVQMLETKQSDLEDSMTTISDVIGLVERLRNFLANFNLDYKDEDIINLSKTDHYMWIWRLYRYMHGSVNIDLVPSHQQCRLGKWYYGEESSKFRAYKSYKDLEKPHIAIHSRIKDLISYHKEGNETKVKELYAEIEELSKQIIKTLDNLLAEAKSSRK